MRRTEGGRWIPRLTLIAANGFAGLSWVTLLWLSATRAEPGSLQSLGWVHLVALGWLTLASLSVLLHVIAAFLGVKWIGQDVARWALRVLVLAIAILVAGFLGGDASHVEGGALLVFACLGVYLVPTGLTIGRALRADFRERMVARAFLITLSMLLIVAVLGAAFGLALKGRMNAGVLVGYPQSHAVLGIAAWLSSLVFGVSARTMRAITGVASRAPFIHIASSSLLLFGALAFAVAAPANLGWLAIAGIVLMSLGALTYALDLFDILRRRRNPNPAPQLYVVMADLWLLVCIALGAGMASGRSWGAALTFVALVGWLGQMVNGHIFHIGIRLMITSLRGDDDETRPWLVVNQPLALASWLLFQVAVGLGLVALVGPVDYVLMQIAALCGVTAWIVMVCAIVLAYQRLRSSDAPPIHAV